MPTDPYESPALDASGGNVRSTQNGIPWRRVVAIPVCLYGALPLLYGGAGLAFIPGILAGGISFPRGTPASAYFLFVAFNATLAAHGLTVIVAGLNVWRSHWRRAFVSILFAVFFAAATFTSVWSMYRIDRG